MALHSVLWARNHTGAKNRTGPVVGCNCGITVDDWIEYFMNLRACVHVCLCVCDCSKMWYPGGRLNKKDGLTRYGNSHVKDKTS